jgi:hypothetical protein
MFGLFSSTPTFGSITNVRYNYDRYSERAYHKTDWASLGAQLLPSHTAHRRHGGQPNEYEIAALRAVIRTAISQGRLDLCEHFNQPHPTDPSAYIICQAYAHDGGGWAIHLKNPDGDGSKYLTLKCDYDNPFC